MSTDPSAAPGTLRIFLPDGTLVMRSYGETYRLAHWRAIDERRIEWQEDSARIEAEVMQVSADQLELRLHLVREVKEENFASDAELRLTGARKRVLARWKLPSSDCSGCSLDLRLPERRHDWRPAAS